MHPATGEYPLSTELPSLHGTAARAADRTMQAVVTIPEGAVPGQPFRVLLNGHEITVVAPPNSMPGDPILLPMPVAPPQYYNDLMHQQNHMLQYNGYGAYVARAQQLPPPVPVPPPQQQPPHALLRQLRLASTAEICGSRLHKHSNPPHTKRSHSLHLHHNRQTPLPPINRTSSNRPLTFGPPLRTSRPMMVSSSLASRCSP